MDADNVHYGMLRATNLVYRDSAAVTSNALTYGDQLIPEKQFQEVQMIVLATVTQETRTLRGPIKAGQKLKLSLVSTAGATVAVTVKNTAKTSGGGSNQNNATSATYTFTNAGTVINFEADCTTYSTTTGAETLTWVPRFSNV